jgi:hypothetical protein
MTTSHTPADVQAMMLRLTKMGCAELAKDEAATMLSDLLAEVTALREKAAREDRIQGELIDERDRACDALLEASLAMDGSEWCGKLPPEPPPNSGDLHLDVPELARQLREKVAGLRGSVQSDIDLCLCSDTDDPCAICMYAASMLGRLKDKA